jgi:hypothetical protein
MLPLRVLIPVFLILGFLQAGTIALSLLYWFYSGHMGYTTSFWFGLV